MNVLLLNTYDWGGAGTATKRIHRGLRRIGVDSRMLVQHKRGDDPYVLGPDGTLRRVYSMARIVLDPAPLKLFGGAEGDFSIGWLPDDLPERISKPDPDLLHLNWVGEGFFNVKTLEKFDLPVVWRLPDMWAFTGGCHYSDGCDRFEARCGSCPKLGRNTKYDLSWWTLRRKRKAWDDVDITVVAPSTWLADQAAESTLFSDRRIETIPNGLDTETYRPFDTDVARDVFGLPGDADIVLFGSISPTSDPRKGFTYLWDALQSLSEAGLGDDTRIVVFGASEPEDPPDLGFDARYVGYLNDDQSLALLYSAADVMIVPSEYEGFGQTATESMACGTPVVAFDATGPRDTVVHEETGYLAEPYDPANLAAGIRWVLEDDERHADLSANARERAVREYDIETVARAYRDLYLDILE